MRQHSLLFGEPIDWALIDRHIAERNFTALCHKQARFRVRIARGFAVAVAKGLRIRWFTLTQSDASLSAGLDFYQVFHSFVTWLRYWYPDFQYCVVEHWKPGSKRPDFHVVCYGEDYLSVANLEFYWAEHFLSSVSGMEEVKYPTQAAAYLAGYLSGGSDHRFVKSTCSQGWVFSGWVGVSQRLRHKWGRYLTEAELVTLAVMSPAERSMLLARFGDSSLLLRAVRFRGG
jgi:hypothetical protein